MAASTPRDIVFRRDIPIVDQQQKALRHFATAIQETTTVSQTAVVGTTSAAAGVAAVFSDATGLALKAAAGTGVAKLTSGVLAAVGGTGLVQVTTGAVTVTGGTGVAQLTAGVLSTATGTGAAQLTAGVLTTVSGTGLLTLTTGVVGTATGTGAAQMTAGVLSTVSGTGIMQLATGVVSPVAYGSTGNIFTQTGAATAAWQAPIVQQATRVTIADAAVKTLPTTPVALVAAPGSGFRLLLRWVDWRVNLAAAYTNIDAGTPWFAVYYSGGTQISTAIVNDAGTTPAATDFTATFSTNATTTGQFVVRGRPVTPTSSAQAALAMPQATDFNNQGLELRIVNGASGNLTGGNAANAIKVDVYYSVVAV